MHRENITEADTEDALVRLAGHVPADVALGRPLHVTRGLDDDGPHVLVVTDLDPSTIWWVYRDMTARLVELPHGAAELTSFTNGHEVDRAIGTMTE